VPIISGQLAPFRLRSTGRLHHRRPASRRNRLSEVGRGRVVGDRTLHQYLQLRSSRSEERPVAERLRRPAAQDRTRWTQRSAVQPGRGRGAELL